MLKFDITLEQENSKLNNIICKEPIDIQILNDLINSDLLKLTMYEGSFYENEKDQLMKYKKVIKNGMASVKYTKVKNMHFGRVNPLKALGLFSFRREIRQTLSKNRFVDIDIENCHPVILNQICIYNDIECEELTKYVENREEYLENVMKHYDVNRDNAKKLFIRLMYFGSVSCWKEEIKIEKKEDLKFLTHFKTELQNIGNAIIEKNPKLQKMIKKRKELQKKEKYNEKGSVVSYFLQEIENRILEHIYDYCVLNDIIKDNITVLCADGIQLEKDKYDESLLNKFSDHIFEKFGLKLKFTEKKMDKDYLSILKDHLITKIDKYTEIKQTVEEKYFMINNLGCFGYLDDEKELKLIQYKTMENMILKEHNYTEWEDGKLKKIYFFDKWMEDKNRKYYESIIFETDPNKQDPKKLNLYTGLKYDDIEYEEQDLTNLLKMMKYILQEGYEYVMNWIAHIIQYKSLIGQAVILHSKKHGVGKSTIPLIIRALLGDKYCTSIKKIEEIDKDFNSKFENKFFCHGDEINAKKKDIYDLVKDAITKTKIDINKKGIAEYEVNNKMNFMWTTNSYNPIKIEDGDRRITFIDCVEESMSKDEFTKLYEYIADSNMMATLFNYLKNRKISKNLKLYESVHKKDLQNVYINSPAKYLYKFMNQLKNTKVRSSSLFEDIKNYEKELNYTDCTSIRDMYFKLKKIGFESHHTKAGNMYNFEEKSFIKTLKDYNIQLYNENYLNQDEIEEDPEDIFMF